MFFEKFLTIFLVIKSFLVSHPTRPIAAKFIFQSCYEFCSSDFFWELPDNESLMSVPQKLHDFLSEFQTRNFKCQ